MIFFSHGLAQFNGGVRVNKTLLCVGLNSEKHCTYYRNYPKFLDRYAWANGADPDQTAPRAV